jgi:hypothetical protein
MQQFLTVLFVLLLCYNKRGWAAVAAGEKSACELRYRRLRVQPKNSNLIENMVSVRTVKPSQCNCFSLFFLRCSEFVNAHTDKDVAMLLLALQTLAKMKMWRWCPYWLRAVA